jgi:hypothetical protein
MVSLERKLGFWNNIRVGIAAIASAFCISASDVYGQTPAEKEAAIKQIYTHAEVDGEENLTPEQFQTFLEHSRKMPANFTPILNRLEFNNAPVKSKDKKEHDAVCHIKGRGTNTTYGISFSADCLKRGALFHEGSHILSAYLKRNNSPQIYQEFDKLRGTNTVSKLTNTNNLPLWSDGYSGPVNGCFTLYGSKSADEDISETVRVVNMHPARVRELLNPGNALYDERFGKKIDFLKEKGFITPEAYSKVK